MNVIETSGLRKSYGKQEVLHGIDLTVSQGRLVGFLGPNGAGKSTTIRILMGLIRSSAGWARVLGRDAWQFGKQIRSDVGYLPGEVRLYPQMTGNATLLFLARARRKDCQSEINRLSEVFDLDLTKKVRKYSSGMKQKLGLIQALMHEPKLLVLDEPTSGLDPLVRKSVFAELRRFVDRGHAVLFSSHTLSEVEELCDDVIVVREGNLVEHQKIKILQRRALRRITIDFRSIKFVPSELPAALRVIHRNGKLIEGTWSGKVDECVAWLHEQSIVDATIEKPNLEDLFMTYYAQADEAGADDTVGDDEVTR